MDRDKVIFVMLTFAFDAGGDDGTEYVTVAGFASSSKDWGEFSVKWKARLNKEGIEFFRAVDALVFVVRSHIGAVCQIENNCDVLSSPTSWS
jgi:hypothetical protein